MFKKMRRKNQEIGQEEIDEILSKGEYGFFSTVSDNGYPYTIPVSFVYSDNCIYFHCAPVGHKLENIKKNSKVSFCVVTDTELLPEKFDTKYKSVVVFGEACEITGDIKEAVLLKLVNKYSLDFLEEGKEYINNAKDRTSVIRIKIDHMTGKARK